MTEKTNRIYLLEEADVASALLKLGIPTMVGMLMFLDFFFPLVIALPHLFHPTGVIRVQPAADLFATILTAFFTVKINHALSAEISKEAD